MSVGVHWGAGGGEGVGEASGGCLWGMTLIGWLTEWWKSSYKHYLSPHTHTYCVDKYLLWVLFNRHCMGTHSPDFTTKWDNILHFLFYHSSLLLLCRSVSLMLSFTSSSMSYMINFLVDPWWSLSFVLLFTSSSMLCHTAALSLVLGPHSP